MDRDIEAYGRRVVANGELAMLRDQLGLTSNAMAEFMGTSQATYKSWEEGAVKRLWPSTAERIGRFVLHAHRQIEWLRRHDTNITDLMPLYKVAGDLGVPQELLLKRYREGAFEADDLGILGLWIEPHEVEHIGRTL